jgi:hypothetical protein
MKKNMISKLSVLMLAVFAAQSSAFAGLQNRIDKEREKLRRMEQRQANLNNINARIQQIRAMPVTNIQSADSRCKAIGDAVTYLKGTTTPKKPFAGQRSSKLHELRELKKDTQRRAAGLNCNQIDFVAQDEGSED